MNNHGERTLHLFPHKRIREHMKEFGVNGFDGGVIDYIEAILFVILKDITEYSLIFRDYDARVRTSLRDIFMCLLINHKELLQKTNEFIEDTDLIDPEVKQKILEKIDENIRLF